MFSLFLVGVNAQSRRTTAPDHELFRTVASLDAAVFEAYNRCDLEKFSTFFTDDLEFYQDKGGLTRSRQSLVESVKNNICGKVRRELVPGTIEVYPMDGYGAVEMGVHRFHHLERENTEPTGEAKFVHLWQNKDGAWKITRSKSHKYGDVFRRVPGGQTGRVHHLVIIETRVAWILLRQTASASFTEKVSSRNKTLLEMFHSEAFFQHPLQSAASFRSIRSPANTLVIRSKNRQV
ncbi:MAG TPA: nuclear transport factor 2 family protein [Blastocatellia bacterium]|nr:nuclear transport factor 2 family protein [Blastocatellia bacterium]